MSDNKFTDRLDRQVIPRWRESNAVSETHEILPLKDRKTSPNFEPDVVRVKAELATSPTVGIAADALGIAILAGDKELADQARDFLSKHSDDLPETLREITRNNPTTTDTGIANKNCPHAENGKAIRGIRELLQAHQNNPLLYLDLARHQAILGQREKAERSVFVALTLAPNHRQVLRAASRFFFSDEQPELAHRILAKAQATKHDPWLISAELATAHFAGRPPKFMKEGRAFLEQRSLKPAHLSELAAAIATQDVLDGKRKDAKRRFDIALLDPTENSLAQVRWAENKANQVYSPERGIERVPGAHEAAFIRAYYHDHDIIEASKFVSLWLKDEPFSALPAMLSSFMHSLLDDYESVERVCGLALVSNPGNTCLQNNLIYSQISSGKLFSGDEREVMTRLSDISRQLSQMANQKNADLAHIGANFGLLLYRSGYGEEGRKAYDQAVTWATKKQEKFSAASAALFHAREALLSRQEWADVVLREAQDLIAKLPTNSSGLKFYSSKLADLA